MAHWFMNLTPEWQGKVFKTLEIWSEELSTISEQISKWQEDIWLERIKGKLEEKQINGETFYRREGINLAKIKGLEKKIKEYTSYIHQISQAVNEVMVGDYKQALYRDKDRSERRMKKLDEEEYKD